MFWTQSIQTPLSLLSDSWCSSRTDLTHSIRIKWSWWQFVVLICLDLWLKYEGWDAVRLVLWSGMKAGSLKSSTKEFSLEDHCSPSCSRFASRRLPYSSGMFQSVSCTSRRFTWQFVHEVDWSSLQTHQPPWVWCCPRTASLNYSSCLPNGLGFR